MVYQRISKGNHIIRNRIPNSNAYLIVEYRAENFIKPARLRAESARAFTGRRCPHSGKEEDFLTVQPDFLTETAVTPERKVKKSFPRSETNRHAEG